jgi:hypothetical protein
MDERSDYSCPEWGSDKTVGLPMLYASGTSRSEFVSVYVGTKENYGLIPTFGTTQTLAAQKLPPPSKKGSQVAGFVVLGLMFLAFGFFLHSLAHPVKARKGLDIQKSDGEPLPSDCS